MVSHRPEAFTSADDEQYNELLEQISEKLEAGEPVDLEHQIGQHPRYADQLRRAVPAMRAMFDLGLQTASGTGKRRTNPQVVTGTLGDYQILREIGRGGMGMVYEAEQISLGRRVALKVLPFAATLDRRHRQRFQNEARAAATLEHPHIVPVYAVGQDRGVHYYAMKLIHGQSLAEVLEQLRQETAPGTGPGTAARLVSHLSDQKLTRRDAGEGARDEGTVQLSASDVADELATGEGRQREAVSTQPVAGLSTERSHRRSTFDRRVAEIGTQAARALGYAHELGIKHRDIKPGNLLLDEEGRCWVTDFGLAHVESDARLTRTGDVIGTLRYMSPEQAQGELGLVDSRADVYGLGTTLYELLTLRPAFPSDDRGQLVQQISNHEPVALRKLRPAIPRELETIVLKAMAKRPQDRYKTAGELAADLQRFLDDRPVHAKPPRALERAKKLVRRHRSIANTAAVTALVMITVAGGLLVRERKSTLAALVSERQQRAAAWDAKALAEKQEQLAKEQRDASDYDAYVAKIQLARLQLKRGDSLFESLDAVIPEPGRPDLRGWEWYYLHSQTHHARVTLPHQKGQVIAWSPSGKKLATLDMTGSVNIWRIPTGQHEKSLRGLPGIRSLSWSPDGKQLAGASNRKTLAIWDVESGLIQRSLPVRAAIRTVGWNPDGIRLVCGSDQGDVSVWNARTGERLSSFVMNSGPVRSVDWHPEGALLLACGGPGGSREVRVWDTSTGAELFGQDTGWGHQASFSPDGRRIVFGTAPHSIVELDTKKLVSSFGNAKTGNWFQSWSPDGQQLATSLLGGRVVILDVETGAVLSSLPGHDALNSKVVWSPAENWLATAANGEVKVWDVRALEEKRTTFSTSGYAFSVKFSPDGRHVLAGARHGQLKIWDAESGEETVTLQQPGHAWINAVNFSPNGKRFAAKRSGGVVIYDSETGKELLGLSGSEDEVWSMAWSPTDKVLAVGYRSTRFNKEQGRVELFHADSGKRLASSSYGLAPCEELTWSPDGQQLAAAAGPSIRLWDATLRREVKVPAHQYAYSIDWSADGEQIAVGSKGGTISFYDAADWNAFRTIDAHSGFVKAVKFHPHRSRIASCSKDGTVRIFDTSTGRELSVLDGHGAMVHDLAWSPDGLRLASAGRDRAIRIWDGSAADRYLKRHGDLRSQAWRLFKQGKYQRAIEILQRLRSLHPREKRLELQLRATKWVWGTHLAIHGDQLREATAIFEQLNAEFTGVADYRLHLPERLFDAGKRDEAITMAEKFVAQFPEKRGYREGLAFLLESQVKKLSKAGRFEEARPILRRLAAEFPGRADYRPVLARHLSAAGEHGEAAAIYRELVADHPDAPDYLVLCKSESAFALIAEDRLDEAIELLQGLKLDDRDYPANKALGNAYLRRATRYREQHEFEKAIADYDQALKLSAGEASTHNSIAWMAVTKPDGESVPVGQAVEHAEEAVEKKPSDGAYWNTLGAVKYRAEDYQAAVTALAKSAEMRAGGDSFDFFFLAMAHQQLGDTGSARQWYQKAAAWMEQHAPDNSELADFRAETEELLGFSEQDRVKLITEYDEKKRSETKPLSQQDAEDERKRRTKD